MDITSGVHTAVPSVRTTKLGNWCERGRKQGRETYTSLDMPSGLVTHLE